MAATKRAPYALPTNGRRRGKPFSNSMHIYLLLRQCVPFLLIIFFLAYYFNFLSIIQEPISQLRDKAYAISQSRQKSSESVKATDVVRVKKLNALAKILEKSDPRHLHKGGQLKKFDEHVPIYGFVQFSSYRTSPTSFVAVGLSGLALHDSHQLGKCVWKEHNGGHRVAGKIQAFYPGEHHNLRYEVMLAICGLGENTDKDTGGDLYMTIDGEEILVYREASGAFISGEPKPPFKYQLSYCSPPLVGSINPKRIYEWIEYHLNQGVDYFFIYDAGGVDLSIVKVLEPYMKLNLIEVVDIRKIENYESWSNGQLLSINDCMYRSRYSSKWTAFFDFNEYFDSEEGKDTLLSLLDKHQDKPYVTLGSRWWSVEKCLPEEEGLDWAIQRMLFHWPDIYCPDKTKFPKASMCLDYHGYRKYVVDPRKVSAIQIHRTEVPRAGGVDIDAEVARFNRWNDLVLNNPKACKTIVKVDEPIEWWVRDLAIANSVENVVSKPRVKYTEGS